MNLEVGMYVRIDKDFRKVCIGIGKIINIIQDTIYVEMNNNLPISFQISEISEASNRLIELIKKEDFVNGHKVVSVNTTYTYTSVNVETSGKATVEIIPLKDIKSIVTKEQMSYKIGE